jgi:hypothetical protein
MRVVLSTYGAHGDVEPLVGLAGQLQVCAPPSDFVAVVAKGCDEQVRTGMMPAGGWL